MTLPVTRRGLFTMGTVCSSSSSSKSRRGKGGKHGRGSLTSSSEVAVEVAKPQRPDVAGNKPQPFLGPEAVACQSVSSPATPGLKEPPATTRQDLSASTRSLADEPSSTLSKPGSERNSSSFVVPPELKALPPEMQNLLMGRWPVLPTKGSKVLRLFVAGEKTDCQVERVWLTKQVFPGLRLFTETMGFHLHVVDIHGPMVTACVPHSHMRAITRRVMNDNIVIWLMLLLDGCSDGPHFGADAYSVWLLD